MSKDNEFNEFISHLFWVILNSTDWSYSVSERQIIPVTFMAKHECNRDCNRALHSQTLLSPVTSGSINRLFVSLMKSYTSEIKPDQNNDDCSSCHNSAFLDSDK